MPETFHEITVHGRPMLLELERTNGFLHAWLWEPGKVTFDRDPHKLDLGRLGEEESWYDDSDDHVACLVELALNETDGEGRPVPVPYASSTADAALPR
jgi:hypothetical protein